MKIDAGGSDPDKSDIRHAMSWTEKGTDRVKAEEVSSGWAKE
ncbi:MAG: hypothetical protein P8P30_08750 [Rickettsiales bacterium]|nr:hypothetical protein [Rickettsiales bacterium]